MNNKHIHHTLQGIWHGCLIMLLTGAVIAGSGYLSHLRFGHDWFSYAGLMAGLAAGALFCTFVIMRLHKNARQAHTRADDRANARLTVPKFLLGLIHYGIITGVAVSLALMAWVGAEDYALERPLDGTVEIVLGWFVSLSIGLTAFHIMLRASDGE